MNKIYIQQYVSVVCRCWLPTEHGTRWAFLGPVMIIQIVSTKSFIIEQHIYIPQSHLHRKTPVIYTTHKLYEKLEN